MNTTDQPFAALEACLRCAGASGQPVTYENLAGIVRDVRQAMASSRTVDDGSPVPCSFCSTTGRQPDGSECAECEGVGVLYPTGGADGTGTAEVQPSPAPVTDAAIEDFDYHIRADELVREIKSLTAEFVKWGEADPDDIAGHGEDVVHDHNNMLNRLQTIHGLAETALAALAAYRKAKGGAQ